MMRDVGRERAEPTIGDVARAAGVSRATVSRVLNDHPRVDRELAARVRAVADRFGYRPNPLAQGLARGATGTVGVVVPDLTNPFFPQVLKGLAAAADPAGYRVLVADTAEDPEAEVRMVDELARRVDGLVLCSPRMPGRRLAALAVGRVAAVTVNRPPTPGVEMASACFDAAAGMRAVVEHLTGLGHEQICYLAGPATSWSDSERRRVLAAGRLRVRLVPAGSTSETGSAAVAEALRLGGSRRRVTALVAFNDQVAIGALAALRERGIAVPAQMSVTGFDDVPSAAFLDPPLTTVHHPAIELGEAAWELLAAMMAGREGPRSAVLTPELVVRGSTAVPVTKDDTANA
jgi:LacI family transcriptional regulator